MRESALWQPVGGKAEHKHTLFSRKTNKGITEAFHLPYGGEAGVKHRVALM